MQPGQWAGYAAGKPYCAIINSLLLRDFFPTGVHHGFAILFGKRPFLRVRQDVEDDFRRAAQARAQRRHHDRAVNQDWVLKHKIDKLVVGELIFDKAELFIGLHVFTQ